MWHFWRIAVGEVVQTSASNLETKAVLPVEEMGVMPPLLLDPGAEHPPGPGTAGACLQAKNPASACGDQGGKQRLSED